MIKPEISVIIPVYNVEKYLERCIKSVINQTFRDLEIILVNDGSTDSSGIICDEFARTDTRIRVIHKPNGGLSSARNVGIENAQGNYIGFVDSDDWIATDMYEYLYTLIKNNKANCASIKYALTTGESTIYSDKEKIQVFTGKDILRNYMWDSTRIGDYSVCICLFETTSLSNIRFREGKLNEDIDFKYKALEGIGKFVKSNKVMYYYFQSSNSISNGGLKRKDLELFEACEELCKLTEQETYKDIKYLAKVKKIRSYFSILARIAYFGISDSSINKKALVNEYSKVLRKNYLFILGSPLPLSRKVAITSIVINYYFFEWFIHVSKYILTLRKHIFLKEEK